MSIQNSSSLNILLKKPVPLTFNQIARACVLFIDMQNFTEFARNRTDRAILHALHYCYSLFDNIIKEVGARPIKYNGDACIILLETNNNCTASTIGNSLYLYDLLSKAFGELCCLYNIQSALRGGLAFGPVLSGKIGSETSHFDIWGHTVNLAARLEQRAQPNTLLMNEACYKHMLNPNLCKAITLELKGFVQQQIYEYHKRTT